MNNPLRQTLHLIQLGFGIVQLLLASTKELKERFGIEAVSSGWLAYFLGRFTVFAVHVCHLGGLRLRMTRVQWEIARTNLKQLLLRSARFQPIVQVGNACTRLRSSRLARLLVERQMS